MGSTAATIEARVVDRAAARALRPPPRTPLSVWSERHRVVPGEVSGNAGRWRNDLFPFLAEIMDCLCPWHWSETVTFAKSSQVGGTESGLNWMFAIADMWPAPTMMVHPTIQAAGDWVREKLSPSLNATTQVRRKVVEQRSRDGASTTLHKSFPGGYWVLAGANSSATLSSKSIRFLVKEEWDRWPLDVDGQGDPDVLADARQTSYHASGKAKQYRASTPVELATSRIWRGFLAGDQRHYHVPCPHCDHEQILRFFPDKDGTGGLIFNRTPPYDARYACEGCGALIERWQLPEMLARGRWIAKYPNEGRQPSFHINALYSPVTTWDKMAGKFWESKDDPQRYKGFVNLWLGEPWEEKGEAPDWQALFARREERNKGVVPRGALMLTCGVDVQADGIYYEVVAWNRDRISWTVDNAFLEGSPAETAAPVWRELDRVYQRQYPTQAGGHMGIDHFGVDSGYVSQVVYDWTKRHPRSYALKGDDGWYLPPLATPRKVDLRTSGKVARRGAKLWKVGTWPLKATLYANLRKVGRVAGAEADPPGYCHFATFQDEGYFKQLTAEHLRTREVRGRMEQEWHASGANHYLDCRIYALALAEFFFFTRFTEADWAQLEADRAPSEVEEDLFLSADRARPASAAAPPQPEPSPPAAPTVRRRPEGWLGSKRKGWL